MAKRFLSQDHDVCQPLRVYGTPRYIINSSPDWQFLFSQNSSLEKPISVLKIAGEFDSNSLSKMRLAAYLYVSSNASTSKAEECTFKFFSISPEWTETLTTTRSGLELQNGYWYTDITEDDLGIDLDGGSSVMLEVTMKKLGKTYRDRTYLNAIGIYGTAIKIKNDVEYLDITKLDE